jgi:hypothetical protein
VRGERWRRLLVDEGARPSHADAQQLNVIGYMGNNLLPARAGDAVRVFLMTPRAGVGMRSVVGTLLAERLLDVGLLVVIFVVVGYGLPPIEGLYIVALASVFAMIPSGPAYAGTQDAAAIIGIKALGGTSAQAVAYVVMLRFVIVLPITLVGLVLLMTRYGGLGRLRLSRAERSSSLRSARG